jgi:hypothetical protein
MGPSRSLRGGTKGGVSRGDKAVRTWHQRQDQFPSDCGKNGSEFVENGSEFGRFGSEYDQNGAGINARCFCFSIVHFEL